ncbi:MAG: glycoside hydrolase family 140 protein [Bacteroidales bacterium]|nr:glycoside hydrolase family 140 protein [Bacteroidales bacterium]
MKHILLKSIMSLFLSSSLSLMSQNSMPDIQISENKHFLQYENGKPFFYLGDTAWELFHRLNREEMDNYFSVRKQQGYNVVQAVALSEVDGLNVPNRYGFLPFNEFNPEKPAVKDGDNNDYWDNVDYAVEKANSLGIYIGLLPTWGRYWNDGKPLFNKDNAYKYGRFIGSRYKNKGVIWILGGDRPADNKNKKEILRAMAKGIRDAGAKQLMTFHPCGGCGSSQWLNDEDWLDFNMRQNGHAVNYTGRYSNTINDYNLKRVRPVIDGEPVYEDHPIDFNPDNQGFSTSADVRRAIYWDLFNGACGHTYGHHAVWQMYDKEAGRGPINSPLLCWKDAIHQPGATQMVYAKKLVESRPYFTRVPAPEIIVESEVRNSVPGAGRYHFNATKDSKNTYAFVYVPVGRRFEINLTEALSDKNLVAWWYNPRNGEAKKIGKFKNEGNLSFISPTPGENLDWILVVDNASSRYKVPGKHKENK